MVLFIGNFQVRVRICREQYIKYNIMVITAAQKNLQHEGNKNKIYIYIYVYIYIKVENYLQATF